MTKGTNVTELYPMPAGLNISPEAWGATPALVRTEICRTCRELGEGIAIAKDRRAGRGKRTPGQPDPGKRLVPNGFYELYLVEGGATPWALRRAVELRERLASEAARMMENDEMVAAFEPEVKRTGMTLPAYLRSRVAVEHQLSADPIKGFETICEMIGVDIVDVLANALESEVA
jgi:hypothetical protein